MDGQALHLQGVYDAAQEFMAQDSLTAWLAYDYRESNPIFRQVIQPSGHVTRPCSSIFQSSEAPSSPVQHEVVLMG